MNKHRFWIHIAIWAALYIFWITIFQNRAFTFQRTLTVEFCYLIFIAANYYLNVYFAIPKLLYQKKYFLFGLTLLAGILLGALLRVPLAIYMNKHFFRAGGQQPDVITLFFNSLLNIFIWVVCLVSARLIFEKIRFKEYIDSIEKEKTKNE